ncbi:MAG TPA: secondary thiamine-phosphate synthase enzyme YjbQ [Atribacteraceae bacterium]|nr:secondary thiamine-phosphate synthase enzyme YjbQ [Atribacteraceae bacterium]
MVITREIKFFTKGHTDIINITDLFSETLHESRLQSGIACLYVPGTTATLTTIGYESGTIDDLKEFWERIVSMRGEYAHNAQWGDGNGYAHVRAALCGPSLVVPFNDGKPLLGTWQDIVCIDFDNRAHSRTVFVQLVGE